MERVVRVDMDERQRLVDGEDITRVDYGSGCGLRRTERVDGADVGSAREGRSESKRSEAGEGRMRNRSTMPRPLERCTRALPECESGDEEIGRRGGVRRRERETGVGEIDEDILHVGDGFGIERDRNDVFRGTADPESVQDGPSIFRAEFRFWRGKAEREDGEVLRSVVVHDTMKTGAKSALEEF